MIRLNFTVPSSGALSTVHVVSQAQLDFSGSEMLTATVSSFVDENAYSASLYPLFTQSVSIEGLPESGQDILSYVEAKLVEAAPEGEVTPYANRRVFAGGQIVTATPTAVTS